MNEQQYRKQLLVQQIDAHRGLVRLEAERVKDLNPVQPFIDLGQQILSVAGLIRSGGRGREALAGTGSSRLDLGVLLPFVIQLATTILRRRGKRRT